MSAKTAYLNILMNTTYYINHNKERMNIILVGANGNMGNEMMAIIAEREDMNLVAVVDVNMPNCDYAWFSSIKDVTCSADIIVDFSSPAVVDDILTFAVSKHIALVIATTGHTPEQVKKIEQASSEIPIFFSGNMSIGICLLTRLARNIAQTFPYADIEIVETHHSHKLDSPSGTSLMLARSINEVRPSTLRVGRVGHSRRKDNEIGISSLRLGCDVGKHEILFDTGCERLTISHQAYSRALYADGALSAMQFILTKQFGLYTTDDLFDK